MRTCIVCRARKDDSELVRAGRYPSGYWYLGRGVGRGAWWCHEGPCSEAVGVSALSRALRVKVDEADLEAVRDLVAKAAGC